MVNHVDPCSPFSGSVALGKLLNSQSLMCVMGLISWRFLVGLLTGRAPRRTGREPALNKGQLLLGLLLLRWSLAVVRVSLHLSSLLGAVAGGGRASLAALGNSGQKGGGAIFSGFWFYLWL